MLKGKERAYLRKLAHGIDPIFQIGKNGIEDNFLTQIREALEARELIKIKVLENSGLDTREASDTICRAVRAEGIQSIGNKIVIYKESKKNPKIEIPKK
ncbi:MAG: ribosome assembly RNA-binding protein YhbY [Clostridium sp.]|uniref:ribosome assembly RNA-binding protein YhbY n=1 Tax=Clostridium sp. TaxID=1506 RepID=UPI003F2B97DF